MRHKRQAWRARVSGFSLLEIAVVIAVIGLLTAGLAAMLSAVLRSGKSKVAAENAAVIHQSLQRFVERYGRLPCPARRDLAPGAVGYGVEDTATGVLATSCANTEAVVDQLARGVVPWVTLGLPLEQVQDGYSRMFTYNVTISATVMTAASISGLRGNMTVHTGTPIALGLVPTGNQINSCMNTAPVPAGGDDANGCNMRAVAILISHGENGLGAFTSQGGALPNPTDAAEIENTDANVNFVKGDLTSSGYDDVVFAWSPDDLLDPLARQGSIRSAMVVTNEVLRAAAIQISNSIANSATCGPPCATGDAVAMIPAASPIVPVPSDGWGTQIDYAPTVGDLCAMGVNAIAFTLRSRGVDLNQTVLPATYAPTGRNDDVVVTVTVEQIRSQVNTRYGANTCS